MSNPEVTLEGLCAEANKSVSARLKAMHNIIKGFKKNNVDLTAPNLVGALDALGISMSKSSIYNKAVRGKPNPYRVLVDAWNEDINTTKEKRSETSGKTIFTEMTDADYAAIGSDVLKFKIENMYNELRSLRHQITLLKEINELPRLQEQGNDLLFLSNHQVKNKPPYEQAQIPVPAQSNNDSDIEEHIEVLESFIQGSTKLNFDEDGCLFSQTMIRKDDVLSDMELQQALAAAIELMKNKA